jgi:citrate lyase subunit beta / citryl-CoA lyase
VKELLTAATWLYVPASRLPELLPKAVVGADAVVIDLEDAVHPDQRPEARRLLTSTLTGRQPVHVVVRVNRVGTADFADDIAATAPLVAAGLVDGVRLPKVESADEVAHAWRLTSLTRPEAHLVPLLESALGVRNAHEIARAPGVHSIALGESDLRADLGLPRGDQADDGLLLARLTVVMASAAAGLPAPTGSVFSNVSDTDALRASCEELRRLGFYGRSVIHPRQVPVVRASFAPTAAEQDWASAVVARAGSMDTGGVGATALADGSFVDPAIVRQAEQILERAAG